MPAMAERRVRRAVIASGLVLAAVLSIRSAGAWSGGQHKAVAPLAPPTMVGRDMYELYCASCHGADGTGAGPVAGALVTAPSDLTLIACRNGGTFPDERIRDYITGATRVTAHGTGDMPVWGAILRGLDPSDARVRVRLDNLTAYVRSLQAPSPAPGSGVPCDTREPAPAR